MDLPLFQAMQSQLDSHRVPFHTPGHKGILPFPLGEVAPFDMTELPLTGSLYDSTGPVLITEQAFSSYYKSGATLLSAGGSTLCIQAMLALFCPVGSSVLMARASHISAINACALLDLNPIWLYGDSPSGVGTSGRITPEEVEKQLLENTEAVAVYITSPDYFGVLWDIAGIASVCARQGKPLLVDNAHGAHLAFWEGLHPMVLGAAACCDSLHKTLPALTSAALLHIKDGGKKSAARRAMSLFGSTSPSYLTLLSMDLLSRRMAELQAEYQSLGCRVALLKAAAQAKGVWATVGSCDPIRISLLFKAGERVKALALSEALRIEAEYISNRHIVLIPGVNTPLESVGALINALDSLDEVPALPQFVPPQKRLSIRAATFGSSREIPLAEGVGHTASSTLASCPPGLPLVMPGEIITKSILQNITGTERCFVL